MKFRNVNDNDVNGTPRLNSGSVASGREGNKASSVVIQRNPCPQQRKRKQMKESIKIGTWNIRTLNRPGKLYNVIREMKKANMSILGLSEVRWKEEGDFISEDVRIIHTGAIGGQGGVAILLEKDAAKSVKNIQVFENRIIAVTLNADPADVTIVQVYMPTTAHEDEEIERIYEQLDEILQKVKGTEYSIIMGDWNAVVGEGREEDCVGKYGLGKRNNRGNRLVEFCKNQRLVITNTCFKHHMRRRYTWMMPGEGKRYQLDYIMVKQRYKNSIKNAHTLPGADADTDHNLVIMKMDLRLKTIRRRKIKKKQWNREDLKKKGGQLAIRVDNKVKEQSTSGTTETR